MYYVLPFDAKSMRHLLVLNLTKFGVPRVMQDLLYQSYLAEALLASKQSRAFPSLV